MPTWAWLCALLALTTPVHAQEAAASEALLALRNAVERAQFERATSEARELLAHDDLRADERNDALELLAIAQIAARDDAGAQETLRTLYTRDPSHTPKLRDPGPQVEAAFARAHFAPRTAQEVPVTTEALRDTHGRTLIEVKLGEGRDAVQSVDLFARPARGSEPVHLVSDATGREKISLTLPTFAPGELTQAAPTLELYVEARAPSGFVLGRDGTRAAPLKVHLEPVAEKPAPRRWWVWTSVAIVVAGVAVGGAIAAH